MHPSAGRAVVTQSSAVQSSASMDNFVRKVTTRRE